DAPPLRSVGLLPGRFAPCVLPRDRDTTRLDTCLGRCSFTQRKRHERHTAAQTVRQFLRRGVLPQSRHEHHVRSVVLVEKASGQRGTSRTEPAHRFVQDRCGSVRRPPVGLPSQVHIQQDVPDHHHRPCTHVPALGLGAPEGDSSCSNHWSTPAQKMCTSTRCTSCTVDVDSPGTATTSSLNAARAEGAGPVSDKDTTPISRAVLIASTTFWLLPLEERDTSRSPGAACARSCRA